MILKIAMTLLVVVPMLGVFAVVQGSTALFKVFVGLCATIGCALLVALLISIWIAP